MNALGDFWGRITGSDQPRVTETKAPPLSSYPSQADARYALEQGFGYGSGNEPYIEAHRARIMGVTDPRTGKFTPRAGAGLLLNQAVSAVDDDRLGKMLDLDKMENWKLKEKLGTTFTQAALAAQHNAIAMLGFDPSRTVMDIVLKGANIGGAYEKKRDAIYANIDATDPSSVLHESIHRGLQKLRERSPEAKQILERDLPEEEYVVRWLMKSLAGDPEKGSGTIGDKQRATAISMFEDSPTGITNLPKRNREAVDRLLEIAAELRKEERPRGPN